MDSDKKLDLKALDTLFLEARTYNAWQDRDVPLDLLEEIYDLAKMGPTATNCSPMRIVFVKSSDAKERLRGHLDRANIEKTMAAPVTVLFAYDRQFVETLPRLFPHTDARNWFTGKADKIEETMWRNGTLQAAYFIMAARALGLDCGPMSGFKKAGVKEEFFPELDGDVNFICNIGYGDPAGLRVRGPRLGFYEVCSVV